MEMKAVEKQLNLKERMSNVVRELEDIILEIQREGLRDTQEALNFVDKINELSVSF